MQQTEQPGLGLPILSGTERSYVVSVGWFEPQPGGGGFTFQQTCRPITLSNDKVTPETSTTILEMIRQAEGGNTQQGVTQGGYQ